MAFRGREGLHDRTASVPARQPRGSLCEPHFARTAERRARGHPLLEVHGNLYATSRRSLQELLDQGKIALVDVDVDVERELDIVREDLQGIDGIRRRYRAQEQRAATNSGIHSEVAEREGNCHEGERRSARNSTRHGTKSSQQNKKRTRQCRQTAITGGGSP